MATIRVRHVESFQPTTVQHRNLWESVLATLRLAIIRGEFPCGTRLVETDLAIRLGVSRGPIREALRQLELEGLVMSQARRSVTVVGITEQDVREIYSLRTLLECHALEQVASRSTPEQVARLRLAVEQMRAALERGEMQAVIEADMVYHRSLIDMAEQYRLSATWEILAAPVMALLATADSVYQDMPTAIEQHSMLVDAIERRDVRDAVEQMRRYLLGGEEIVLGVVASTRER